jgi:hypothetical protein
MMLVKEIMDRIKHWFYLLWAVMTIALFLRNCHLSKVEKSYQNLKESVLKERPIEKTKDSSARVEANVVLKQNRDVALKPYEGDLERKGVKQKNVKSVVKTSFTASGVIMDTLYLRDTLLLPEPKKWHFSDGYLTIDCELSDSVLRCPYSYTDTMMIVTHAEGFRVFKPRTWLKKNRKVYTDVKLSNPSGSPVKVESVIIE